MITKEQIAEDNDIFRTTMIRSPRHRIVLSERVSEMLNDGDNGRSDFDELISKVRNFNSFTPDNDPFGEHDFGKIVINNKNYYWKIDYYDEKFEYGSDPNEGPVSRVLTIMRAEEY